jgi:hypothetical protein
MKTYISLKVPDGGYCWKYKPDVECPGPCEYFDNYEYYPGECRIFGALHNDDAGVLKDIKCKQCTEFL